MAEPHQPQRPELARAVADRLPLLVNRLGGEMANRAEVQLAGLGLSGKGYMALAVLETDRPSSQLELAGLLGCAPAVVVAVADELEHAGYVDRARDPADRRRSLLVVTPAGRRALAKGDRIAAGIEDELLGHLPAEDRERLHEAMRVALAPAAVPAA